MTREFLVRLKSAKPIDRMECSCERGFSSRQGLARKQTPSYQRKRSRFKVVT